MKTIEQFDAVPAGGMVIRQEGAVLRVFFDIEKMQPQVTEDGTASEGSDDVYTCYNVDVKAPFTYGAIVSATVNDRYSADDVQALSANLIEAQNAGSDLSDDKRREYLGEWADFQAWRAKAKQVAAEVVNAIKK